MVGIDPSRSDGTGLYGLKFVLVLALSLDIGVSGFPPVRIPFPRNADAFEKLFLYVFGYTDVWMYLLVHFVTSQYGFLCSVLHGYKFLYPAPNRPDHLIPGTEPDPNSCTQ